MTGRLKLIAAALGLVLATGTIADVSAETLTKTQPVQATQTATVASTFAKPAKMTNGKATHRIVLKSHRLHVAHLRHARKLTLARHHGGTPVVKAAIGGKTIKHVVAVRTLRERHAMNHRVTTKTTSVIR